jgi:GAF domain-containing protein
MKVIDKSNLFEGLRLLLADKEEFWVGQLANATAMLLHEYFQDRQVNWLGFYLLRNHELVLGPFQGKVSCVWLVG